MGDGENRTMKRGSYSELLSEYMEKISELACLRDLLKSTTLRAVTAEREARDARRVAMWLVDNYDTPLNWGYACEKCPDLERIDKLARAEREPNPTTDNTQN